MSLESKVAQMEEALATRFGGNRRDCAKGLKLPKGTPVRWCSLHRSYGCWKREDPAAHAEARLILDALNQARSLGLAASEPLYSVLMEVGEPSIELVEECRRMLLAQGFELEEGA